MANAVIAQIGAGLRIIGPIGLHAVRDRVITFRRCSCSGVIVVLIIVIAWRVIRARSAIIAVTIRSEDAADDSTRDGAGDEAAAAVPMAVAAAMPGSAAATANMRLCLHSSRAAGRSHRRASNWAANTGTRRTARHETSSRHAAATTNADANGTSDRAPGGRSLRQACGRHGDRQNQSR